MDNNKINNKAKYKFLLIKQFYSKNISVDQFCEEKELKRRTFYRWLKQYEENDYEGLIEKSKRPHNIRETPNWAQDIIVELHNKIGLGCKNISNTPDPLCKVSHSGVLKILKRKGVIIKKDKKRWITFRSPYKNHTWQIDFLGPYSTVVGEISILVILDDYSRYARSKIVKSHGRTDDVISFLNDLIKELGKPFRLLTDNGKQFRKTLDKWCNRNNIKHHKSRVRHPQTMGKVEALNKTLGKHFTFNFKSLNDGQIKLNSSMEWYNHIHYHSIIESTPATAYGIQKDKLEVLRDMANNYNLFVLKNRLNNCAISQFT